MARDESPAERWESWIDPEDVDDVESAPDPDDPEAWFRCGRCRRRHARPPLVAFAVDEQRNEVTAAYERCPSCFGERMGMGPPVYPPPQYDPEDQEAGPDAD